MIADRNSEIINKEWWGQFYQGMISGATGGATPTAMAVSAFFTLIDGFKGYAEDDVYIDQSEMLDQDKEFQYDYSGKVKEEGRDTAIEEGIDYKKGEGTYKDAKKHMGAYKESKQKETKAIEKYQKAEGKAAGREQKISNSSSDKMKGRAKGARQKANHQENLAKQATQEAQKAKGKFIGGLIGFGMGIGGAAVNMLIDREFQRNKHNMTYDIVSQLQDLQEKDMANNKIVSDGK